MPIWTLNKPPTYKKDAVMTERGWEDPVTGEILDCIRQGAEKAGSADVDAVAFLAAVLTQGGPLAVKVRFNERVNTHAGASIVISGTGATATVQLFAVAQTNVQEVIFDKQSDLVTSAVVPSETTVISVPAQSIVPGAGYIEDNLGSRPYANYVIDADLAASAGTRSVA
jgi:hypothetical protein